MLFWWRKDQNEGELLCTGSSKDCTGQFRSKCMVQLKQILASIERVKNITEQEFPEFGVIDKELIDKKPDFTVLNCSDIKVSQPENYHLNSELALSILFFYHILLLNLLPLSCSFCLV